MRLLAALNREPLDRPPIWFMRQAGRYLPEYRELRNRHSFDAAMRTPALAAEITLQPLRRFPLDAAIVFADIMTPLPAMGVPIEFDPGPKLTPLTLGEIARLGELAPDRVAHVAGTIELVRTDLDPKVAVVGFAGGPVTLLAYLLEGGGSQHFPRFREAFHGGDPTEALRVLARAMGVYLQTQIDAGAEVVQLFDTWAGLLSPGQFRRWAVPAAREALRDLGAPTIYFAPAATHLLEDVSRVGATGYGVDWRLPLGEAWHRLGDDRVIQGNLDPAALLSDPGMVRDRTAEVLDSAAGRPGHVFNLGHGVLPDTPVENVAAMVDAVVGYESGRMRSEERMAIG
ncbi:MAG: uroporphyrinogen decarboxylase [Acidimicrobiia bacterium]